MRLGICLCLGATVGASFANQDASAQYQNGFVWNHTTDYGEGVLEGAAFSFGNPQADALGLRAWSYEWVPEGEPLNDATPWYEGLPRLMTWDPMYFCCPRWSKGDDLGANISGGNIEQTLFPGADRSIPMVRWTNPLAGPISVEVSDQLTLRWPQDATTDIEVALTKFSRATQTHELLFSTARPRPAVPPLGETEMVVVAPIVVEMVAGDSLTISTRAIGDAACCIGMGTDLTIQLLAGGDCPIDTNGDREINFGDLTTVLGNWLATCP